MTVRIRRLLEMLDRPTVRNHRSSAPKPPASGSRDTHSGDPDAAAAPASISVATGLTRELPSSRQNRSDVVALTQTVSHPPIRASASNELAPVFVPAFNNPTFLRNMVEQLEARSFSNITVLDNASTFPAMLELLEELSQRVQVRRLGENLGPRAIFTIPSLWESMPQVFCLTDPDLAFNADMPSDVVMKLYALSERYQRGKVGLALDISDPSSLRDDDFEIGGHSYKIWEWEAQFWNKELEPAVFDAPIDTTFALYNKRFFDPAKPLDALRVAGVCTCQHLPWRRDFALPPDELNFYRSTNVHSFYLPNATSGPPVD